MISRSLSFLRTSAWKRCTASSVPRGFAACCSEQETDVAGEGELSEHCETVGNHDVSSFAFARGSPFVNFRS